MRPLVVCALLTLVGPAPAAPAPAKAGPAADAAGLAERLVERIDFDRVQDTPLRTVLDAFQARTEVTVLLDYKALQAAGGDGGGATDEKAIKMHAVKGVRGETVLRQIADQIDAVLFYTPDHVLLTSPDRLAQLVGPVRPLPQLTCAGVNLEIETGENLTRPTAYVTAGFREMPLTDAVRAMSLRANRTAVVSADAADTAKTAVTASLANVPFETAVATLAEAAGLRAVRNGNTVLVVTAARAKELAATEDGPRVTVGLGNTLLTLDDLQTIARLFAAKPTDEIEALRKEVNRLRAEKVGGK